jgi:hypothetical protein
MGRKRHDRTTKDGADQLVRTLRRIVVALELPEDQIERSIMYGQIELSDTRSNHIAFGIGATLYVRLVMQRDKLYRFRFEMGWSSCGGSPADAIAQATIIRQLAERAAIAQCIAHEHGAEWTPAEVEKAIETLRDDEQAA